MIRRTHIPLALTALRALLAPVVVALALLWPRPWAFALCLVAAFLSDLFDGIVARRLGGAWTAARIRCSTSARCSRPGTCIRR